MRRWPITVLERAAAHHWSAADQADVAGWRARAQAGFTGRANSALALDAPAGGDVPAALAAVTAWYGRRGLPPRVALPWPEPGGLADGGGPADAALPEVRAGLERAGWRPLPGGSGVVHVRGIAADEAPQDAPDGVRVEVSPTPDARWKERYRYRGGDLPPAAEALLMSAPEQVFVRLERHDGLVLAVARLTFGPAPADAPEAPGTPDAPEAARAPGRPGGPGPLAGVTAVDVHPQHRRQGLGGTVMSHVHALAARRGARALVLQASDVNPPALALYAALGYAVHHRYDYWTPPA